MSRVSVTSHACFVDLFVVRDGLRAVIPCRIFVQVAVQRECVADAIRARPCGRAQVERGET